MGAEIPEAVEPDKPKLVERVRDAIRRKHSSLRTEQVYVDWIKRFILFHGKRHPDEMAEPEVTEFLTHLARVGKVAASTQNQALSALLFLYREVLEQPIGWLAEMERVKRPPRLPVRIGYQDRAGTPGAQGCFDDDDLHPCADRPGIGVRSPLD